MWNIVSLFLICSLEISCLDAFDPYPMHSIDSESLDIKHIIVHNTHLRISFLFVSVFLSVGMGVNVNTFIPLKIVSRLEWLAQPPENDLIPMRSSSIRVIIAHTATEDCMTQVSDLHEKPLKFDLYFHLIHYCASFFIGKMRVSGAIHANIPH